MIPVNEQEIKKVKYSAPQILKIKDGEMLRQVDKMIFTIGVVTGWQIPDHQHYKDKLREQLKKKCKESYYDLNFDEIEYAFRTYGSQVEDWGKVMNLSLIDKVIGLYKADREVVSLIEEQKNKPKEIIYTDEQLDNLHRQWTEEFYQRIRSGKVEPIPQYVREILIKDGLLKENDSVDAFFVSKLSTAENIYKQT